MWAATRAHSGHEHLASLPAIGSNAHYLHEDWRNLLTLIARIEWTLGQVDDQKGLHHHSWAAFTALDVEHFHVELRSAFDYLARIVTSQSTQPRQTPGESYNSLSKWAEENPVRAGRLLGNTVAIAVAESRQFFLDVKRIRELVVHSGAHTLVFPSPEGILFQVYARGLQFRALTGLQDLMLNDNAVNLRRYASSTLLRLWELVEAVSVATFAKYSLPRVGLGVMAYHAGLRVLREWGKWRKEGS